MPFAPATAGTRRWRRSAAQPGRSRRHHLLTGILAGLVAVGVTVALPTAAHAAGNSLYLPGGGAHVDLGANASLYIDGTITYDDHCEWDKEGGVDDFFYPATDVYIVPAGSVSMGDALHDAGGQYPNTIIGTGSGAFLDEPIAVVYPTGKLGDGDYDVVYDTCQDGKLTASDAVFPDAITVDVPDGQIPPVDPSIKALKDKARQEYATWLKMHIGLTAILKIGSAKSIAGCLLNPTDACMASILQGIYGPKHILAKANGRITSQALALVANQAAHFGAIWQDPADPDFDHLPVVETHGAPDLVAPGRPIPDAFVAMQPSLQQQDALTDALLHALERYQGAEAKGDPEWALVQARAVRDLSSALEEYLSNDTAVADLRAAFADEIDVVTADLQDGASFVNRVRTSGFTADERRALLNRGVTAADITGLENDWVADGPARALTADEVLGMFDAVLAADDATRQALQDSVTGWDSIVSELEQRVDDIHPEADAGGPYAAPRGEVTLDATASTASPAAHRIVAYAWDLDGDGQFDDATGGTPAVHVDGSRTVAVQVTDDNGRQATDFAQVTVTLGDRAPVVESATPAPATTVTVGDAAQLAVTASDPDGDPLSYSWTIDGAAVDATGPALDYQATADAVGEHVAQVTVGDGHAATVHQWSVSVLASDADQDGWTATTDCDDTRADVHPGAYERPDNGLDDDCDPASQDAPPGGLTGSVMAWGSAAGTGLPPRADQSLPYYSPMAVTSLGSTVTSLESDHAAGYAVLADGTVRSWGLTYKGRLGTGDTTATTQWNPTPVLNVGGAAGSQLSNITQVSAQVATALAVRDNGTVVAWGSNLNHEVGDNSSVGQHTSPVNVLTTDGTPLAGVGSVEMGEGSAYAVMRDGTVRDWGVERCDGDAFTTTRRPVATPNPRFGTDVVQIASGDGGGALVRKADGSLWSCGGYEGTLGRPYTNADKADLRPVIGLSEGVVDVSMGSSAAVALREDGSVWVWGKNVNHSLDVVGLAGGYTQQTPVQVTLPDGPPVLDVEADYSDTFHAVRADGSVLTWGANTYGSAGDGTTGDHVTGIARLDLGGARAVAESGTDWNGLALVRPADDAEMEVPAQYVTAAVADTEVTEGTDGSATLTLSGPAPYDLDVTYTVDDGPQQTATIAQGDSTAELPVSVPGDGVDEADWTLPLQLVSISHAVRVAGAAAVVTVHDADAAPRVSVGDARVSEGSTSLTDVSVPVTLSAVSGRDVEVSWSTVDGTATAPADYADGHGVAIIPAGQTSTVVHLSVVGDTVVEPDEALTVRLAEPVYASLGRSDGTVTVTDDEPLPVTVGDATVTEGDAGTTPVTFTVAAAEIPDGETLTVPWGLRAGTAEIGGDVQDARGELTLTSASPSAEVTAQVVGDTAAEPTETFRLALGRDLTTSAGRPVIPLDGGGVGTVVDDDPSVSADAGPDVTGGEGSPIALHGTASAPATWSVDDARCEIADAQALDTTVTCADDLVTTVTLTADDGTGRSVSDTASLTVENLAPSVHVVSPVDGTSVDVGETVSLQADVDDPGSDEVSCSVAWGDGTTSTGCSPSHAYDSVGSRTITVTADDGEGGTATASVTVDLVGLPFDGFFPPVDNPPSVNVIKAGSSVPMKFSLHGYRGMDIIAAGYPASGSHVCGSSDGEVSLEPTQTPGSSQLTYDGDSDRYQYVWQTAKSWAGQCRTFTLELRDGSVHTAEFRLR